MSLSVIKDLIHDAASNKQYNQIGFPTYIQIDRSFMVTGLRGTDTTQVTETAINFIKTTLIPVGALHPSDPYAKARYYRAVSQQSDDSMEVIVSYVYTDIPIDTTQYTIESSTFLEVVETDTEYTGTLNPDGSPHETAIIVPYYKLWLPGTAGPPGGSFPFNSYGTVQVERPRKRLIMTKTIYSSVAADTLEQSADQYVGYVNDDTFRGKEKWTWLCMDVDVISQPYAGQRLARLEFVYKPEGWFPWARFSSGQLGVPSNVFKHDSMGQSNGFKNVKTYLPANFDALVSLI